MFTDIKTKKAFLKGIIAITGNLSAAYYGYILLSAKFAPYNLFNLISLFTYSVVATILLVITIYLERKLL